MRHLKPRRGALGALAAGALALALMAGPPAAEAQNCGNDGAGFQSWLGAFKGRAQSQGISSTTLASAFADVGYDANVVRLDRSQRSFKLSFEEFYARRVSSSMIKRGQSLMQQHQALFQRIESRYGVPAPVLVAIWGLETHFATSGGGKHSIVGAIATLAYDCRRSEFFEKELIAALRIIQRGDMSPASMRGGWAGEIGPMQFLPSSYFKFAVDFDGDGRRNLMSSTPDMLASTANYLKSYGWQAGQSWGPGTSNYNVIREWNKAEVYVKTISVMASRLAGQS